MSYYEDRRGRGFRGFGLEFSTAGLTSRSAPTSAPAPETALMLTSGTFAPVTAQAWTQYQQQPPLQLIPFVVAQPKTPSYTLQSPGVPNTSYNATNIGTQAAQPTSGGGMLVGGGGGGGGADPCPAAFAQACTEIPASGGGPGVPSGAGSNVRCTFQGRVFAPDANCQPKPVNAAAGAASGYLDAPLIQLHH